VDSQTRLQRSMNATYQVVADEAILIHMKTGVYYSLNQVGTLFWQLLDGSRSVADCATALAQEYNAPRDEIQADLIELGDDLVREGLAEVVQ